MKVLVINTGSSSVKYQLFDMDNRSVMASGLLERIGDEKASLAQTNFPDTEKEKKIREERPIPDHESGLMWAMEFLIGDVIADLSEIDSTGLTPGSICCPVGSDSLVRLRASLLHGPWMMAISSLLGIPDKFL